MSILDHVIMGRFIPPAGYTYDESYNQIMKADEEKRNEKRKTLLPYSSKNKSNSPQSS